MEISAIEPLDDMAAGWTAAATGYVEAIGDRGVTETMATQESPRIQPRNSFTTGMDIQASVVQGALTDIGRIIDLFA